MTDRDALNQCLSALNWCIGHLDAVDMNGNYAKDVAEKVLEHLIKDKP